MSWSIIVYLLIGTGYVSDDFSDLYEASQQSVSAHLIPHDNFINVPVGHWVHHIWFSFFHLDHPWMLALFKIIFTIISCELLTSFFKLFVPATIGRWVVLFFIFYPSHDSIPYWYAPSGHLLSLAIYFQAYVFSHQHRYLSAFALASLASFMVYGSTPTAIALTVICALHRNWRGGVALLMPQVLYVFYFVGVSMIWKLAPTRILEPVTGVAYVKQYLLQIVTFLDATIGPSFWLKICTSIGELTICSSLLAAVVIGLLVFRLPESKTPLDRSLLFGALALTLASFGIFAATGRYPQLAFNLGNRTTFWGSLLVVYLLWTVKMPRWVRTGLLSLIVLSAFGVSDHWKAWNRSQQKVISEIRSDDELKDLPRGSQLLVSGHQYSKLGPFSHIEFLSENWVVRDLILLCHPERHLRATTINWRFEHLPGKLRDRKTGNTVSLTETTLIFDTDRNKLWRLKEDEMDRFLAELPRERRHWSQFHDLPLVADLRRIAIYLMPRLKDSQ